jgi:nitrite reductase/ring-hydroxylating ferredoxin subunit
VTERHVVARADEIPPGERKLITIHGRQIGVFNIGGEFFALLNRCPHQGGKLCRGNLVARVESDHPGEYRRSRAGELLKCPWHGWMFNVRTGQSWCDPEDIRATSYVVTVEPGEALARGPFVAEIFPVAVEDAYVVVQT